MRSCPFCGSYDLFFNQFSTEEEGGGFIECLDCRTAGPDGKTFPETVNRWNRRRGPTGDNACTTTEPEEAELEGRGDRPPCT